MEPSRFRGRSSVAVFLSNYNHGRFLPEALNALLSQSLPPANIHIVDDASTDGSQAVIDSYLHRYPGIVSATFLDANRGFIANVRDWISRSDNEFILIAAADDRVAPTLLEKSVDLLRQFPDAGLCSAEARLIDENGLDLEHFYIRRPISRPGLISSAQVRRLLMAEDAWFMGNATLYRGDTLREVGFDRELGAFADGFACRVIALRYGACFIPEELAYWRRMDGGMATQAMDRPEIVLSVMDRATRLMQGPFKEDFPPGYAARWRRRWLFATISRCYAAGGEAHENLRALTAPLPQRDRLALQLIGHLPLRLARLAGFAWLRPFDMGMMVRHLFLDTKQRKM